MSNGVGRHAWIYEMKWRISAIKPTPFPPSLLLPLSSLSKESTPWIIEARGFFSPWIIQEIASIFLFPFPYIYCVDSDHISIIRLCCYCTINKVCFFSCLNFSIDYITVNCINHTLIWFLNGKRKKKRRKDWTSHTALSPLPSPFSLAARARGLFQSNEQNYLQLLYFITLWTRSACPFINQ